MKLWATAWRNLWRNRRRTLVTTAAMALALLATILYSTMVEGYLVAAEHDALDYELASAQVFAPGYRDRPSLYTRLEDADALVAALDAAGIAAAPRLLGAGLVAAHDSSAGATFIGVDVARDARVLRIQDQLAEGVWLDPQDATGVVLGRKLARTLGVAAGGEVVVLSQAADGSTANELFRVRGVLRSVGDATDRAGLFMPIMTFRELMAVPTGAHQLLVRRPVDMPLTTLGAKVAALAPGRDVQTWRQLMPIVASMLDSMRGLMGSIFFVVYVVIAIVILNAMLMAVFERIKELGVLKALGAGPRLVLGLIFVESMLQVVMAILAGVSASLPLVYWLATVGVDMGSLAGVSAAGVALPSRWIAVATPVTWLQPIVMLVIVVGAAVLYPSMKAARIQPVEAMRHQ